MFNIAVFVSGGGTNLQAIIDSIENNDVDGVSIALVVSSNPNAYALERARKYNIGTAIFKDEQTIIDCLKKKEINLVVLAGFMIILSEEFINMFKNRIINVHPSLIPSFCGNGFYGLKVHEAALNKGVKVTGATVHFVNSVADDGPIILQKAVEVLDGDTPETLQKRVMTEAEWQLLPRAISLISKKMIKVSGNRVEIKSGGGYY